MEIAEGPPFPGCQDCLVFFSVVFQYGGVYEGDAVPQRKLDWHKGNYVVARHVISKEKVSGGQRSIGPPRQLLRQRQERSFRLCLGGAAAPPTRYSIKFKAYSHI